MQGQIRKGYRILNRSSLWDSIYRKDREGFFRGVRTDSPYHRFADRVLLNLLRGFCGEFGGKRVLFTDLYAEAGGASKMISPIHEGGGEVFGIDISREVLRETKERFRGMESNLAAGDLSRLPFRDSSFDIVFSHSTIDHLPDPSSGVAEIGRVLKSGGRALITADSKSNPLVFLSLLFLKGLYRFPIESPLTLESLASLCVDAGISVEKKGAIFLIPPLLPTLSEALMRRSFSIGKGAGMATAGLLHLLFHCFGLLERLLGQSRGGEYLGKYVFVAGRRGVRH